MKAKRLYPMDSYDYAVPPGWTIKEQADWLKLDYANLADRLSLTSGSLDGLFCGTTPIDEDLADKLSLVLELPRRFIINLELEYRKQLVKIQSIKE